MTYKNCVLPGLYVSGAIHTASSVCRARLLACVRPPVTALNVRWHTDGRSCDVVFSNLEIYEDTIALSYSL